MNIALRHMREIEKFGVGVWTPTELAFKASFVRRLMQERLAPEQPRISVIVPAYREQKYILATLRSLAEQSYSNCEFIVVVNGEVAGGPTQKIAEAAGFRVVHVPQAGITLARQAGLEAARGDIIVTTDADTVHSPLWLDRISAIMAGGQVLCGAGLLRSLSRSFTARAAQAFISWTMRAKNSVSPRLVTGVSEANSFYRRGAALALGGYDLAVSVGEGIMLFKKLRRPGMPLIFTDEELVVYTSGRRIEKEGALRWLRIVMHNTALQLFGQKGVDHRAYPDVR